MASPLAIPCNSGLLAAAGPGVPRGAPTRCRQFTCYHHFQLHMSCNVMLSHSSSLNRLNFTPRTLEILLVPSGGPCPSLQTRPSAGLRMGGGAAGVAGVVSLAWSCAVLCGAVWLGPTSPPRPQARGPGGLGWTHDRSLCSAISRCPPRLLPARGPRPGHALVYIEPVDELQNAGHFRS